MRTLFPLRSNANGLVAGAPAEAVMRRVKMAALLGDVLVQDGLYDVTAGPDASMAWISPTPPTFTRYQTARERNARQANGFAVSVSTSGGNAPPQQVASSMTSIHWVCSFQPLKNELKPTYPWIDFDGIELNPPAKKLAAAMSTADRRTGTLAEEPSLFVRNRLVEHVNIDLVASSCLDAAVSMDARHLHAIAPRVAAGQAAALISADTLAVLAPSVSALTWQDIDELRATKGWSDLRALWAEIGQIAADTAASPADIATVVRDEYEQRLRDAAESAEGPRGPGRWIGTALGIALGTIPTLSSWPVTQALVGGVAATAAGMTADAVVATQWRPPVWRVADAALADRQRHALLRGDDHQ